MVLQGKGRRLVASGEPGVFKPYTGPLGSVRVITGNAAPPGKSLETGSTAAASPDLVKSVQRELSALGYDAGVADGTMTLTSRAAVMAYEHDNHMPLTGEASEPLLRRILLGDAEPNDARTGRPEAPAGPKATEVIQFVQKSLAGLGYLNGRADGRLGSATASAIRRFETQQTLPVSGRISGTLVARLQRTADRGRIAAQP